MKAGLLDRGFRHHGLHDLAPLLAKRLDDPFGFHRLRFGHVALPWLRSRLTETPRIRAHAPCPLTGPSPAPVFRIKVTASWARSDVPVDRRLFQAVPAKPVRSGGRP